MEDEFLEALIDVVTKWAAERAGLKPEDRGGLDWLTWAHRATTHDQMLCKFTSRLLEKRLTGNADCPLCGRLPPDEFRPRGNPILPVQTEGVDITDMLPDDDRCPVCGN